MLHHIFYDVSFEMTIKILRTQSPLGIHDEVLDLSLERREEFLFEVGVRARRLPQPNPPFLLGRPRQPMRDPKFFIVLMP
jgi:hypothetical protein